jgi:hypothetical protein
MTAWFSSLGTENELPEPQPDIYGITIISITS